MITVTLRENRSTVSENVKERRELPRSRVKLVMRGGSRSGTTAVARKASLEAIGSTGLPARSGTASTAMVINVVFSLSPRSEAALMKFRLSSVRETFTKSESACLMVTASRVSCSVIAANVRSLCSEISVVLRDDDMTTSLKESTRYPVSRSKVNEVSSGDVKSLNTILACSAADMGMGIAGFPLKSLTAVCCTVMYVSLLELPSSLASFIAFKSPISSVMEMK